MMNDARLLGTWWSSRVGRVLKLVAAVAKAFWLWFLIYCQPRYLVEQLEMTQMNTWPKSMLDWERTVSTQTTHLLELFQHFHQPLSCCHPQHSLFLNHFANSLIWRAFFKQWFSSFISAISLIRLAFVSTSSSILLLEFDILSPPSSSSLQPFLSDSSSCMADLRLQR